MAQHGRHMAAGCRGKQGVGVRVWCWLHRASWTRLRNVSKSVSYTTSVPQSCLQLRCLQYNTIKHFSVLLLIAPRSSRPTVQAHRRRFD